MSLFAVGVLLAACGPASHPVAGRTLKDFGYPDDGRWIGGAPGGPAVGLTTQLRADRLAKEVGLDVGQLGSSSPHSELWLHVGALQPGANPWERLQLDRVVGSEGGLATYEASTDLGQTKAQYWRLPAPYVGVIWCRASTCQLEMEVDGLQTGMQLGRSAVPHWKALADGWSAVVRRQAS